MKKKKYLELATDFPCLGRVFKTYLYKYNDKMKVFLMHMLERVDYFQKIGEDAIHDIIYSLENHFYDAGEYL